MYVNIGFHSIRIAWYVHVVHHARPCDNSVKLPELWRQRHATFHASMVDIRGLLATSDDDGGGISSGSQLEKGHGGSSSGNAFEKGTGNISKPKGGWFGKCRKHCGPYDRPPWNPLAVPDDSLLLDADIDEQVYWEEPGSAQMRFGGFLARERCR